FQALPDTGVQNIHCFHARDKLVYRTRRSAVLSLGGNLCHQGLSSFFGAAVNVGIDLLS
ncbi:hypothetical protein BaRGS_00006052, partial [Batillaria attramentaria]